MIRVVIGFGKIPDVVKIDIVFTDFGQLSISDNFFNHITNYRLYYVLLFSNHYLSVLGLTWISEQ